MSEENLKGETRMNLDQKLSEHFTLREMTRTSHRRIDNTPSPDVVERLTQLCLFFLEPVRERFGPLWVTSGYRCKELNDAIGGSKTSAHIHGCAADLVPIRSRPTIEIVDWVVDESGLDFDQIIDEYTSTSNWIHLGMMAPFVSPKPRQQALTMRHGKYSTFDRNAVK